LNASILGGVPIFVCLFFVPSQQNLARTLALQPLAMQTR